MCKSDDYASCTQSSFPFHDSQFLSQGLSLTSTLSILILTPSDNDR